MFPKFLPRFPFSLVSLLTWRRAICSFAVLPPYRPFQISEKEVTKSPANWRAKVHGVLIEAAMRQLCNMNSERAHKFPAWLPPTKLCRSLWQQMAARRSMICLETYRRSSMCFVLFFPLITQSHRDEFQRWWDIAKKKYLETSVAALKGASALQWLLGLLSALWRLCASPALCCMGYNRGVNITGQAESFLIIYLRACICLHACRYTMCLWCPKPE